jgi:hypothetical protein
LASDQRPPAVPPTAAYRGASARGWRTFFYVSRVGTRFRQTNGNNGSAFFFCLHSFLRCAMAEILVSDLCDWSRSELSSANNRADASRASRPGSGRTRSRLFMPKRWPRSVDRRNRWRASCRCS